MKKALAIVVCLVVIVAVVWRWRNGSCSGEHDSSEIARIAREASAEVGEVCTASDGTGNPSVVVLEEFHNSRAGQIQHAITMVRLHAKHGLKDIGLEGYLRESPRIDATWFTYAFPGESSTDRARVAVQLLEEGEISAAEFMKLTYDDVELQAIEEKSEYDVEFQPGAPDAVRDLAQRIDPDLANKISKKLDDAVQTPLAAEEQLAIAEDLEQRRLRMGIRLSAQQERDWESWLAFWRGRAGGNRTMFDSSMSAAATKGLTILAMNVGAAHTEGISNLLKGSGRGFAVVTPLVMKKQDHRGDLDQGFDRKYKKLSVFSGGFLARALENSFLETPILTLPIPSAKKPEPVINQPWFEAKGTLYMATDRITHVALSQGGSAGRPPWGFDPNQFKTPFLFIDPRKIEVVPNGSVPNGAVLFPVTFNPNKPKKAKTIWVKAALGNARERDADSVEAMLQRALTQVQSENEAPTASEDSSGQIRPSASVVASPGPDKDAVKRKVLSTS